MRQTKQDLSANKTGTPNVEKLLAYINADQYRRMAFRNIARLNTGSSKEGEKK